MAIYPVALNSDLNVELDTRIEVEYDYCGECWIPVCEYIRYERNGKTKSIAFANLNTRNTKRIERLFLQNSHRLDEWDSDLSVYERLWVERLA